MLKSKFYLALFIAGIASLLVVGCAETPPASGLEDVTWILESYGEEGNLKAVIEGTRITATFNSTEGEVRGSAGCNSYFGEYHINGGLSIPVLAHTEMYCMEPEGVMEQEYEYLSTLSFAESFQIEDGKLQINCGNQRILIYTVQTQEEASTTTKDDSEISQESTKVSLPLTGEVQGPLLSDELVRGCQHSRTSDGFGSVGLSEGETAVNFTLQDIDGNVLNLSGLLSEKPVVMVFGSFTWPPFRQLCATTNELYTVYDDRVHFVIIYTIDAHPTGSNSPYFDRESPSSYSTDKEGNPVYQPLTYEERLELARQTATEEEIDIPLLVDEIDNPVWCTYGPAPNIAYLIGTEGKIITRQGWYNPEQMESAILAYFEK